MTEQVNQRICNLRRWRTHCLKKSRFVAKEARGDLEQGPNCELRAGRGRLSTLKRGSPLARDEGLGPVSEGGNPPGCVSRYDPEDVLEGASGSEKSGASTRRFGVFRAPRSQGQVRR